jgi:hypothetical protein
MIPTSYRGWFSVLLARGSARLYALTLSILALWSTPALACKCKLQTVDEAKQDAVAIFEGRVTSIVDEPKTESNMFPGKTVTVALVRTWRALENQEAVSVRTGESGAMCGYGFEVGVSYLVYAAGEPDKLLVTSCSRTRPLGEASEDLAALGAGVTPVKIEAAKDTGAKTPPKTKSGGCATSGKASASAATASLFWLGVPALGLVFRRRD